LFYLDSFSHFYFFFFEFKLFSSSKIVEFLIGILVTLAFLVKIPIYLFHLWLPKAHVEAPVAGSIILAGVLLKLGGYALIRMIVFFSILFFYVSFIFMVSCVRMVIVGIYCTKFTDIKLLVAYSSVSHMAISLLGVFSSYISGNLGCLIMLLSHGICSSGIFYFIGLTYSFTKRRRLMVNKGISLFVGTYSLVMFILFIPNMAVPITINLFSEIFILFNLLGFFSLSLVWVLPGIFLVAYFTVIIFRYSTHGSFNRLIFKLVNLNFDSYLVVLTHAFLINVSFIFINIF
jgi:NADH-ubiquinone oxidoreductase chain 4